MCCIRYQVIVILTKLRTAHPMSSQSTIIHLRYFNKIASSQLHSFGMTTGQTPRFAHILVSRTPFSNVDARSKVNIAMLSSRVRVPSYGMIFLAINSRTAE